MSYILNILNKYCVLPVQILFVVVSFTFSACNSPTEVPANRIKIEEGDGSNVLKFVPSIVNFSYMQKFNSKDVQIEVTNLTSSRITVGDFNFTNNSNLYSIFKGDDDNLTLEAKGKVGDSKVFTLTIRPLNTGVISDTMRVNNLSMPMLTIKALVPHIFTDDVNFKEVSVGSFLFKAILIANQTDKPVYVKSAEIKDTSNVFSLVDFQPDTKIEPNSTKQYIIKFTPINDVLYSVPIEFNFAFDQTNAIIDNIGILTGKGK